MSTEENPATEVVTVENDSLPAADSSKVLRVNTGESKTLSPLVSMAMSEDVDITKLEKLMEMQVAFDDREAMKAYHRDLALAKAEMPPAKKNSKNEKFGTYADLDDLLAVANPCFAKYGISVSWKTSFENNCAISSCILSHSSGHKEVGEPVPIPISEHTSNTGKKITSSAQDVGKAMTYSRRYSFTAVAGMSTEDNDGNDDQPPPALPAYSDKIFEANMPRWQELVNSGQKTPDQIANLMVSKFTLTEDQENMILSLVPEKPKEPLKEASEADKAIGAEYFKEADAAAEAEAKQASKDSESGDK